jgi:hypothetical protein
MLGHWSQLANGQRSFSRPRPSHGAEGLPERDHWPYRAQLSRAYDDPEMASAGAYGGRTKS